MSPRVDGGHHGNVGREDDLLRRFQAEGDSAAMEALVAATRPRLVAIARRIGAPQDAEDATQAAYHALLRRGELPAGASTAGWLVTTVVRVAYRRKAVVRRQAELAERLARPRDDASPPERACRSEEDALVRHAVHRLPDRYRDAVVLHHLQGLPLSDVARLLDVPEATAKTRVQRGRALLRLRLASRFAYGLVVMPFALGDGLRWGAWKSGWIGGAVKAKAASLFALAVAFGLGAGAGSAVTMAVRPRADHSGAVAHPSPVDEPERPRRHSSVEPPRPEPSAPAAQPRQQAAPEPKPREEIPASVARAAATLAASDDALRAAMTAFQAVHANDEVAARAALVKLHDFGDDGFRAVVALLRGGKASTYSERLVEASWSPGGERLLVDLAETPGEGEAESTPHIALWCLGVADTPAVRDYLLLRAAAELDPSIYMNITHALGRLKEARGIALCQDKLAKRDDLDWNAAWNEVIRRYILGDVVQMAQGDKDAGRRALVTYLRGEGADHVDLAIRSLRMLDPETAKTEATALLAGPRARTFSSDAVTALRDASK